MLRPIGFQSLDEALPMLARGFPALGAQRWGAALARLRRFGAADPSARAGFLLESKGRPVGVMLTIPSTRPGALVAQRVVNLSSWYVEPEHRWRAARMLQTAVACETTLFTDLTPTPAVCEVIGRLGFRELTGRTMIVPLPLLAIRPARDAHVVPLADVPPQAFDPPTRTMLEAHAALDCIVGGLWDGVALHPLIFSRKAGRGLGMARAIFAGDRRALFDHMPAIARFLLRERILVLAVNADRSDRIRGAVFMRRPAPTFYKGPATPRPCDFAYSEFVFLQI